MTHPTGRGPRPGREQGFTLIEMVVSLALGMVVLVFLAAAMAGILRGLAVQKARTQGNEVATQGIEALQRVGYNFLGVCAPAPNPPAGLENAAAPVNCPNPFPAGGGESPCGNTVVAGTQGIPRAVYSCTVNNITYDVTRYVAWGDPGQTSKRMAVFVTWRDEGGVHTVSQQSSVRTPGQWDIVGLRIPEFSSVTVNNGTNTIQLNSDGTLQSNVPLSATVTRLSSGSSATTGDKVYAVVSALDASGGQQVISEFLSSNDGTTWTGSIPVSKGYRFGTGSQFVAFSTIRSLDGKANSRISPAVKLCSPPDTSCSSSLLPAFSSATAVPSSAGPDIKINAAGALVPSAVNLTAVTSNTTAAASASVIFQTRSGAVTVLLRHDGCPLVTTCSWSGEITSNSGYAFTAGDANMHFTVFDGSTGVSTVPVKFSL